MDFNKLPRGPMGALNSHLLGGSERDMPETAQDQVGTHHSHAQNRHKQSGKFTPGKVRVGKKGGAVMPMKPVSPVGQSMAAPTPNASPGEGAPDGDGDETFGAADQRELNRFDAQIAARTKRIRGG